MSRYSLDKLREASEFDLGILYHKASLQVKRLTKERNRLMKEYNAHKAVLEQDKKDFGVPTLHSWTNLHKLMWKIRSQVRVIDAKSRTHAEKMESVNIALLEKRCGSLSLSS